MINNCDILIVIPFFNEQARLPEVLDSILKSAKDKFKVHAVLVNHLSTDKSLEIAKRYSDKFFDFQIINETIPVPCGGQPRNTGLKEAIKQAEEFYNDSSIPIATLDADVVVSINFISEIIEKLNAGFDIVSFIERYNSKELIKFVAIQLHKELSIRNFIGLSWLRYQVLWALIKAGIKETRGSGGYAMRASTLKELGHKQPFDANGRPITGENNRLGIIAYRKKLRVYCSNYYSQVHPRREIVSCINIIRKGYSKNKDNAEIFKLARETESYPVLSEEQLNNYLINGIKRTIRMVLIRAVAYDKLDYIKCWFTHSAWQQIITRSKEFLRQSRPTKYTLEVIGNGFYNDLFGFVVSQVGEKEFERFVNFIANKIPDNKILIIWAKDNSLIIDPDPKFINNEKGN
jgi:glycosyltransferase involved in cell wall biosynthesis